MLTDCALIDRPAPSPGIVLRDKRGERLVKRSGPAQVIPTKDKKARENEDWVACISRIREAQDEAAFARLFAHFAPRVKAFLMRSGADATLAEECAQEVMATLWQKAHLFDPSRASAATWIFTIARNRKIDALRKQKRPEPEDLPWGNEPEPDQADVLALQEESDQLGDAIAALPEKQRVLIEKAYFSDLSHSEIAEQTGLPLGTIKSRIRLALDRLRHAMK
nr:sigma-70 family RNA polymerase sigma factor [Roseovarius marisflavi]